MRAARKLACVSVLITLVVVGVISTSQQSIYEDPYGAFQGSLAQLKNKGREFSNRFKSRDSEYMQLLPATPSRRRVYTYFEGTHDKDSLGRELGVLAVWRRAYWAAGFEPVVLTSKDGKKHPKYYQMRNRLKSTGDDAYLPLLGLAQAGGEILIDRKVLPMGGRQDEFVDTLQSAKFERFTTYTNAQDLVYTTNDQALNEMIERLLSFDRNSKDPPLPLSTTFHDFVQLQKSFTSSLAVYTDDKVTHSYPDMEKADLPKLMNAHMHENFLRNRPDGVQVLDIDLAVKSSRLLIKYAEVMARQIAKCPDNPVKGSCPPNLPGCDPCSRLKASGNPQRRRSVRLRKEEEAFVIAVLPHPYDLLSLSHRRHDFTSDYIVRNTEPNKWLKAAADSAEGEDLSVYSTLRLVKDAALPRPDRPLSWFWVIWEQMERYDHLSAMLGFDVHFDESNPLLSHNRAEANALAILNEAKEKIIKSTWKPDKTAAQVEKWNLEDLELWKFVRAVAVKERLDLSTMCPELIEG